ncbi:unnamed protein product [Sphenostylis stenocarpa]|uniref:Uncharacterized protein n=1 Tax=Sphenostylis stenocarpa TaxID=92480 RepID=A0AA86RVX7_9FABA|nr:unnamed protein product [Sphenostylis stenocarpa]
MASPVVRTLANMLLTGTEKLEPERRKYHRLVDNDDRLLFCIGRCCLRAVFVYVLIDEFATVDM